MRPDAGPFGPGSADADLEDRVSVPAGEIEDLDREARAVEPLPAKQLHGRAATVELKEGRPCGLTRTVRAVGDVKSERIIWLADPDRGETDGRGRSEAR